MATHHCPNCGVQLKDFDALSFGNVTIDEPGRLAYNADPVYLPPTQFILADALVRARGRSVTRSMLANLLSSEINDSSVTKYINRLREAFRTFDPHFDQIECVKGFSAYRWIYREVK
jgi:DNA-binding response OmpR family regulator